MKRRRWISGPGARGALAALLASLAGAGFSAHTGWSRDASQQVATLPTPSGYEAEDHFPGAALIQAIDDHAAPAPGATGTAQLPALPAFAVANSDPAIVAARPFALAGSAVDHARALQCLTSAIYYEAASEPDAGQAAVAQVILNRVRHPAFPTTVCGVVYQGSDRRGCQFSYACDGSLARVPMRAAWERARRAAARALAGYVHAPVGLATHYHTYAVTPAWNRTLVMTDVVGAHFFHRWKGWWGTPAAFSQRYLGGEPPPGPLASPASTAAPSQVAATSAALLKTVTTPVVVASAQPTPDEPGSVRPEYRVADADDQILDRWKDSGKPLR